MLAYAENVSLKAWDAITSFTPRGADERKHCEFHNICYADDIPRTLIPPGFTLPFTPPFTLPSLPGQNKAKGHAGVRSQGGRQDHISAESRPVVRKAMNQLTNLKIVQLTDIHIEKDYAEVII